jgi:hypothetical protein
MILEFDKSKWRKHSHQWKAILRTDLAVPQVEIRVTTEGEQHPVKNRQYMRWEGRGQALIIVRADDKVQFSSNSRVLFDQADLELALEQANEALKGVI